MSWINDAKISTKLITGFVLCAFITLGVGVLGSRGVSELAGSLKLVFSNNLASVTATGLTQANAGSQNRAPYRFYRAAAAGIPLSAKD